MVVPLHKKGGPEQEIKKIRCSLALGPEVTHCVDLTKALALEQGSTNRILAVVRGHYIFLAKLDIQENQIVVSSVIDAVPNPTASTLLTSFSLLPDSVMSSNSGAKASPYLRFHFGVMKSRQDKAVTHYRVDVKKRDIVEASLQNVSLDVLVNYYEKYMAFIRP